MILVLPKELRYRSVPAIDTEPLITDGNESNEEEDETNSTHQHTNNKQGDNH